MNQEQPKTVHECRAFVNSWIASKGMREHLISAKTVNFQDLARANCVFVTILNPEPSSLWSELKALAVKNGFRVTLKGDF